MVQTEPGIVAIALVFAIMIDVFVFLVWIVIARRRPTREVPPQPNFPLRGIIYNLDGYPGLAKFQFAVWTVVILPVFTWVYLVRLFSGVLVPVASLPVNILALLGISVVAVPVSDSISYQIYSRPDIRKGTPAPPPQPLSTMLQEGGQLSLSRLQMFMWTFISVVIYLLVVYSIFKRPETYSSVETLTLPDIDPALVVLMGLSQTGYIGAKTTLIPTKPPQPPAAPMRPAAPPGPP